MPRKTPRLLTDQQWDIVSRKLGRGPRRGPQAKSDRQVFAALLQMLWEQRLVRDVRSPDRTLAAASTLLARLKVWAETPALRDAAESYFASLSRGRLLDWLGRLGPVSRSLTGQKRHSLTLWAIMVRDGLMRVAIKKGLDEYEVSRK